MSRSLRVYPAPSIQGPLQPGILQEQRNNGTPSGLDLHPQIRISLPALKWPQTSRVNPYRNVEKQPVDHFQNQP